MSLFLFVKKKMFTLKWRIIWHYQYVIVKLRHLIPLRLSPLLLEASENVLILAPHADDEWIGCYSVLKSKSTKITCCYMNMYGNNYSEYNIKTRTNEIKESSRYWGFKLVAIKKSDIDEVKNCLIDRDVCFIPSPYDWHPEHRETFCMFYQAYNMLANNVKENIRVYYYSVSIPHGRNEVLEYIPLHKKDIKLKWSDFLKIYPSQAFMPSERYKLQLRLVPNKIGYAAQLFVNVDEKRMREDYNLISQPDVVEALNQSSHDIRNILKSRCVVDRIVYCIL